MAMRKTTVGLLAFLRGSTNPADRMPGCANYDHHHGGCLFCNHPCTKSEQECRACWDFLGHSFCKVERGQRCTYFERVVLPTTADMGLQEHVNSQYARHVGTEWDCELDGGNIRKCPDCGAELMKRRRYCDKCRDRRRRKYS